MEREEKQINIMIEALRIVLSFLVIYHHAFAYMKVPENDEMGMTYIVKVCLFLMSNITVPIF